MQQKDYYVASWENDELTMEPFCQCGKDLDEESFCDRYERECDCTSILCEDHQSLAVVEKFVHGNPNFRNFDLGVCPGMRFLSFRTERSEERNL